MTTRISVEPLEGLGTQIRPGCLLIDELGCECPFFGAFGGSSIPRVFLFWRAFVPSFRLLPLESDYSRVLAPWWLEVSPFIENFGREFAVLVRT